MLKTFSDVLLILLFAYLSKRHSLPQILSSVGGENMDLRCRWLLPNLHTFEPHDLLGLGDTPLDSCHDEYGLLSALFHPDHF